MNAAVELRRTLETLAVSKGDLLGVHSSIRDLFPDLRRPEEITSAASDLIAALKEAVGSEGLLMLPTFTYCFVGNPRKCVFHPDKTPSRTGILTDIFRRQTDTLRSLHPTHSVAVWGRNGGDFLAGHETKAGLGLDSPFHRLATAGGRILFLGTNFHTCSLIHVAETVARAPYIGKFRWAHLGWSPNALVEDQQGQALTVPLFEVPGCSESFEAIRPAMLARNALSAAPFASATVTAFRATDLIESVCAELSRDWTFLLCPPGKCPACDPARQ